MPPPQTIGRYQILSELGHGAMGAVYKAHDPMMDRTVAIKTILAAALSGPMAQEYRERFTREAKAAGRLTHPGIVTVYDVGDLDGTPYLVMEFVNGRTLASAMDAGERFSFDRIYELGQQVADALGYAHRNGVVHRDIKPANILLATGGPGELERAKIADLGVAKLTATQITTTGQLLGTPAFMPPEQFTGAIIDGRADLFSLGVILYWLATGDKPFAGDTITAVSYKIVHSDPAQPRRINPAVPAALERIILKCLEKDPAARYLNGETLAADLAAGHAGREIMQTSAPVNQTSPGAALAPVSIMDGDPNTTLDSDARLQMAGAGHSTTVSNPPVVPAAKTIPLAAKGKKNSMMLGAVAVVVLAAILTTWGVVRHRRKVRAEAEAAAAQAQAQILAQQQEDERQKALAAAQATLSNSATGTPDPNAPATGQPPQPTSGTTSSSTSTNPATPPGPHPSTPGTGTGTDKKPAPKTPPKNTPPKTSSTAQQSLPPNPNPGGTPAVTPPPQQPQPTTSGSPSNPPGQTPAKPPAATSQTTTTPPATNAPPVENAKLHIDDGRVPLTSSFTVIMDGQVLFTRPPLQEGKPDPANTEIVVPPGTHEFQVKTASGGIQVGESRTIKADFPPKKKMTLKIELRDNSSGQTLKKNSKLDGGTSEFMISVKSTGILGF